MLNAKMTGVSLKEIYNLEFIKECCICENLLDTGGNGKIYLVPESNLVIKNIILRFWKGDKLNKYEKRKYCRFCDEIKVVTNNQDKIAGILPICAYSELPEHPQKNDLIYYVMPRAQCIRDIEFASIKNIVKAFLELYKNLNILHSHKIFHRDIKPSNIYKYEDKYVFSDFGLVDFPEKLDITMDERKVGAWTTIAPEMERDPFNADYLCADIYSMAKTFWIILTKEYKSFEGQYNYKDDNISLSKYLNKKQDKNIFLGILNDIIQKSTANNPKNRPAISEIIELLKVWLVDDFKKQCELEWEYMLRDIVPYRPRTIVWDKPSEICKILNIIGKIHGINHTFFPGGGGWDFYGSRLHKDEIKIEIDLGDPIVLIPGKLQLNLYENAEWNHFYLETNKLLINDVEPNYFDAPFFQLDENTYIEPWWKNYDEYNGQPIPQSSKPVMVGHYGNYVIFSKQSAYNTRLERVDFPFDSKKYRFDVYDGLHNKIGNADEFSSFIGALVDVLRNQKKYYNKFMSTFVQYAECVDTVKLDNDVDKQVENINAVVCELQKINFKQLVTSIKEKYSNEEPLCYILFIEFELLETYVLGEDFTFKKYHISMNGNELFEKTSQNMETRKLALRFNSMECAIDIKKHFIDYLSNSFDLDVNDDELYVYFESFRKYRIDKPVFSRDDIIKLFQESDDAIDTEFIIDMYGEARIITKQEYAEIRDTISAKLYSFKGHSNILGSTSGERVFQFIDENYMDFLSIYQEHLETGERITTYDDVCYQSEEELINNIKDINLKYQKQV
jgi:serine/threonine protein kinase